MNKISTGVIILGLTGLLGGCDTPNPIEAQKERIIENMNTLLKKENIGIPSGNTCSILVVGDKANEQLKVALVCNDVVQLSHTEPKPNIEEYTTIIENIHSDSLGNLSPDKGSCLKMISRDLNGDERYVTSLGCGSNT